ncbi:MAG: tripartite tricarboxylate transporter substrate binding protein [Proteobacteria bacterium]|nr:tripartite tricarboxylate transporter substrate binding protein [Pseudomonadota bacterium]
MQQIPSSRAARVAAVAAGALAATGLVIAAPALAQAWPAKPVRIIVAFPPGGISDFAARAIAPGLTEALRQTVVVENRGGAAGAIGTEVVAKSAPDGHTLLAHTVTFTVGPHMTASPPADPLRDVMAVTQIIDAPNILVVTPSMPVRSVKELVALAAKRRGELSFASSGYGSGTHLSGELFKLLAKIDMIHIAYKGGGPAVADLLGGHVPTMFSTLPSVTSHVAAGRLRALAVTGARRFPSVPEVPTMIEAGVAGYSFSGWSGIFAPIGTPREIAVRFAEETARVLRAPGFRDKLLIQGADAVGSTPDEFAAFVRSEYARWGQLVRQSGIKAEQ